MKKNYGPDPRSLGGRAQIIQNMYSHHEKLVNTKPSMNIKKPRPHVDAKKRKKGIKKEYNNDYEETYETFRRAYNIKHGDTDHHMPKSYKLKKKILKRQKHTKTVT